MIKSDRWIKDNGDRILRPFIPDQIKSRWRIANDPVDDHASTYPCISFGTSSFGYDIRLATDGFRVFSPIEATEIDPKNFDSNSLTAPVLYTDTNGASYYRIPPHGYALGVSVERFQIPDNVLAVCLGKSTYARCGLIVNTTPLEPGWRGRLVLELANSANLPLRVYVDEGIAQVLFFESDEPCEVSYADRTGKYQDQTGVTTAKV